MDLCARSFNLRGWRLETISRFLPVARSKCFHKNHYVFGAPVGRQQWDLEDTAEATRNAYAYKALCETLRTRLEPKHAC